jgi:pimeloyl-ACP methyl ester carboxylesterase
MMRWLLAIVVLPALAQPVEEIVTVKRGSYSIAGLVSHGPKAKPKYGIALFAGHPGILKLREERERPAFNQQGNFLIRTRRFWLDAETLTVAVDAPSDQWTSFEQRFRQTARYGADVAALLQEVGRRFGIEDWTLVGTSEGSVSAFHAARMNPALARRAILTSSLFESTRIGPGLSDARWGAYGGKLLWVHHADDPCPSTSYRDAQSFAKKSGAPLLTVRGGGPERGPACEPFSFHGFVGAERATVEAMRGWVKTGLHQDVAR